VLGTEQVDSTVPRGCSGGQSAPGQNVRIWELTALFPFCLVTVKMIVVSWVCPHGVMLCSQKGEPTDILGAWKEL